MKLHPSKALLNALNAYEVDLYKSGYFPQVNFNINERSTTFNLFEKMDVGKLLFKCLDDSMIKAGIEYGAFSRNHGDKFISAIKSEILDNILPITSVRLISKECVGMKIKLWGIEDRWNFRTGTIAEQIYMDGIIFDVAIDGENGYFEETGSAYIWEIAMIEDGSVWRPFHLSKEEKQTKGD